MMRRPGSAAAVRATAGDGHGPGSGERSLEQVRVVLLVEDDKDVRFECAIGLAKSGFKVLEAENADQARALVEAAHAQGSGPDGRIDIVFSDIDMPGAWDGRDLARWLRADYPHIAVLLTSGRSGFVGDGGGEGDGFAFIDKPYSRRVLVGRLRALLAVELP